MIRRIAFQYENGTPMELLTMRARSSGAAICDYADINSTLKGIPQIVEYNWDYRYFFLFDEQIAKLFVQESYVVEISAMALRIMGVMYWPLGMIFIIRGLLNGAGDAGYALINGIVEVAGRIGFSVLFVFMLPVGMWSVWIATGLTWCLTAFTAYIRYRKGIWKTTAKVTV